MKLIALLGVVATLAGCVTASGTTDIVPIGKDTFMVGRPGGFLTFSGAEVKTQLYRDANQFCLSRGKHLMPLSESSRDSAPYQYANAELQFRCLADGDPELARPTMRPRPNVTIEMQK